MNTETYLKSIVQFDSYQYVEKEEIESEKRTQVYLARLPNTPAQYPSSPRLRNPTLSSNANICSTSPGVPTATHSTRSVERILCKRSAQRFLAAHLLTANKRVNSNRDGAVDVSTADELGQTHLAERFGDTEDRLQMADSDGISTCCKTLLAHISKQSSNLVLIDRDQLRTAPFASIEDVFPQHLLRDFALLAGSLVAVNVHVGVLHAVDWCVVDGAAKSRVSSAVGVHNESGQAFVFFGVDCIADHTEDVETRENGLSELDVLTEWDSPVVSAADRVGCCNDCTTSL
jgi:hypothetical protein